MMKPVARKTVHDCVGSLAFMPNEANFQVPLVFFVPMVKDSKIINACKQEIPMKYITRTQKWQKVRHGRKSAGTSQTVALFHCQDSTEIQFIENNLRDEQCL